MLTLFTPDGKRFAFDNMSIAVSFYLKHSDDRFGTDAWYMLVDGKPCEATVRRITVSYPDWNLWAGVHPEWEVSACPTCGTIRKIKYDEAVERLPS